MDIFEILREAKSPSKTAPKVLKVSTSGSNDYTAEVDTDDVQSSTADETTIDATDTKDSNDYTAEVEEVEPTDDETDNDVDETDDNPDYTDDIDSDDDSESTDYTEDIDGQDSQESDAEEQPQETEQEQSPEETVENKKKAELLDSVIDLYYNIQSTCSKLDAITHVNVLSNKVNIQVKQNLTTLQELVYKFIVNEFNSNTYVKNLYIYNYVMESYKINIEMLKRIADIK